MRRTDHRAIPPAALRLLAALCLAGCSDPAPKPGPPEGAGAVAVGSTRAPAPRKIPVASTATASAGVSWAAPGEPAARDPVPKDGGTSRPRMMQDLPVPDKALPIP